jgi:L-threonylcarbamoyladenylate synthase
MRTILTRSAAEAADIIKKGGLAAFPTETVYGLGADVFNETALENIFKAKGRPADNPLIVHIGELAQIEVLTSTVTANAEKFINAFFPGPLTLVLPKSEKVSLLVTAGLDTVGIRMPGNISAQEFLRLCETPVAAPSANLSGRPSPTTWQAVFEDLDGRIDCILQPVQALQGEETEIGLESTVVDCTARVPQILRSGAVTLEQLRAEVPETQMDQGNATGAAKSPGLKHKHYSPRARVVLIDDVAEAKMNAQSAYIGIGSAGKTGGKIESWGLVKICPSVTEYAHAVFEFFRECDRHGIGTIYCQKVAVSGLGMALMDRLNRAAQN